MDIGSYERFVNESFSRPNSMTCGAVLEKVIKDERSLAYEGKWVSLDYHVPDEIITWIKRVTKESNADIAIIEIGGTVGEVGNGLFLEANKIMKIQNPKDVIHIHVSYLPIPSTLGEMKSKPVQISTQLLNNHGLHPDFLIARSKTGVDDIRKEKLSRYCFVKKENVISAPDTSCIYDIPMNFEKANIGKNILLELGLKPRKTTLLDAWKKKTTKMKKITKSLDIGIVGKYFKSGKFDLKDSYVSVLEAINHAAWELGYNANIHWIVADELEKNRKLEKEILKMNGLIVPQGWGSRGAEGKIRAIQIVRENKIPYLGLCYGMQMAVVEYCRNVLNIKDANSQEVNPKSKDYVIHLMEEQKKLLKDGKFGGTIRLGAWPCKILKGSLLESLYLKYPNTMFNKMPIVMERHRHRYEFNNKYREVMESAGVVFSGTSPNNTLVEAIELRKSNHPFFVATQYHPELKSRFLAPHPIFLGFIKASSKRKI